MRRGLPVRLDPEEGQVLAVGLAEHADQHRSQRPILLAIDQQLAEGAALWVAPEFADPPACSNACVAT